MPVSPLDALKNAQLLRESKSTTNVGQLEPLFEDAYSDANTADPYRRASALGRVDDLASTFGDSPAISALRDQADARRLRIADDQNYRDAEMEANGLHRGLVGADIQNQVNDVLSEGAAGRQFGPMATALHDRNLADKMQFGALQYKEGPTIAADAARDVAETGAKSRLDVAALENQRAALEGLLRAYGIVAPKASNSWFGTPDPRVSWLQDQMKPSQPK